MAKTKSTEIVEDEEMQLFEHSAEIATEFVKDEILTKLDEFELNNEDEHYIYGFATHGLFVEIISRMGAMGYTEKELRKELKNWINTSHGQILH